MKKISQEIGENMSDEEIKNMLKRVSKNGTEITFEEFYEIMKKKWNNNILTIGFKYMPIL